MRAVLAERLGGPDVLRVAEVERPEPVPTEVLVRVAAAGVNPVDYKTRTGAGATAALTSTPYVPGWDVAGVVEEVGFGVTRFAPGDRVFGMPWFPRAAGTYAEFVTAPSRQLARVPDGLDLSSAAGLPLAALTAWQALVDTAGVGDGDRVLIHAAGGGVGHLAVQIAKARGAHVIGTARAEHHDRLHRLGLDEAIDYTEVAFEKVCGEVDVVLDLVGSADYGMRSLEVLAESGIIIPVPSGAGREVLDAARERGLRATNFLVEPDGHGLEQIAALVQAGKLTVEVGERLPLAEAARAHELLEQGRVKGKAVLVVDDAVA